ncbi:3-methyladenine DNA glycosylase [Dactylosporangium sp. NPDC050688]|uniref:3-methyladenine DNA glycosylase n=1 Tax=Dactylosporangium sp. NPDC050688 TaxID=3157217 RepID=UPI0033E85A1F
MTAAAHRATSEHLTATQWHGRRVQHEQRIDGLLSDHLAKRATRGRHSIEEFLLTYYNFRPAQLRRWQPGPDVVLADADPGDFGPDFVADADGGVLLDVNAVLSRRRASVEWIHRLLASTAGRAPHFGCFGMHEWAMVYRQTPAETRHNILPLRLGPEATAALVDEITVRCSHFDAFRFFTPPARPLNLLQPTRETQHEHDQPACLHANMDVYRWAYKLSPLVPSELVADCFELAREIRTLDMRASPYDLTTIGLTPLHVETPEGRAEYVRFQRNFAERSSVLRALLIGYCERALN